MIDFAIVYYVPKLICVFSMYLFHAHSRRTDMLRHTEEMSASRQTRVTRVLPYATHVRGVGVGDIDVVARVANTCIAWSPRFGVDANSVSVLC